MIDPAPTSDELRAAHAAGRGWAEVFRLPFRQRRWRGQTGEFAGSGVGSSLDFQDHRAYLPGDDPRQINWQAYARTGHYTMKLYREEVRPLVDVVWDVSPSMFAFADKRARTLELLYFLAENAGRSGASVKVYAVAADTVVPLAEEALLTDKWWPVLESRTPSAPNVPPALARVPLRGGSMRLLLSDLLFPGAPEPLVQLLASRNGRGLVFAPSCADEAEPDWEGNLEFIDAETQAKHLHRLEPPLLRRYLEAYRRHFDLWKAACQRYGVPLTRVASGVDLGRALRAEALVNGALESAA